MSGCVCVCVSVCVSVCVDTMQKGSYLLILEVLVSRKIHFNERNDLEVQEHICESDTNRFREFLRENHTME